MHAGQQEQKAAKPEDIFRKHRRQDGPGSSGTAAAVAVPGKAPKAGAHGPPRPAAAKPITISFGPPRPAQIGVDGGAGELAGPRAGKEGEEEEDVGPPRPPESTGQDGEEDVVGPPRPPPASEGV